MVRKQSKYTKPLLSLTIISHNELFSIFWFYSNPFIDIDRTPTNLYSNDSSWLLLRAPFPFHHQRAKRVCLYTTQLPIVMIDLSCVYGSRAKWYSTWWSVLVKVTRWFLVRTCDDAHNSVPDLFLHCRFQMETVYFKMASAFVLIVHANRPVVSQPKPRAQNSQHDRGYVTTCSRKINVYAYRPTRRCP